jgi:RND family efflux transporter MFP subunit
LPEDFPIDADLLKELHIDGGQRDGEAARRGLGWPAGVAALTLVVVAFAGGWWLRGDRGAAALPAAVAPAAASAASSAASPAASHSSATPGAASASAAPAAGTAVLQATGYITARRQATVSAQITGTLTEVLIEEGDHVARGQVLARLEDSGLRASLRVAEASVASSKAQVAQAEAQLSQSQSEARRQEALVASRMVTPQAAEQARTAVATFAAQLEARRRDVDAAEAQLSQARVNFDYTVVRAPFAGVITAKSAQVGEIISPFSAGGGFTRTGVGTIVDMESLEVDVDVGEAYIRQVTPGMRAEAVLDAYPDWKIPAHVIAVVPTADRGKATVKVRVALERKDPRLLPDIGVRVSFLQGG